MHWFKEENLEENATNLLSYPLLKQADWKKNLT